MSVGIIYVRYALPDDMSEIYGVTRMRNIVTSGLFGQPSNINRLFFLYCLNWMNRIFILFKTLC